MKIIQGLSVKAVAEQPLFYDNAALDAAAVFERAGLAVYHKLVEVGVPLRGEPSRPQLLKVASSLLESWSDYAAALRHIQAFRHILLIPSESANTPAASVAPRAVVQAEGLSQLAVPLPHPSVFTMLLRNRRNDLVLHRTPEVIPEWCIPILKGLVAEQEKARLAGDCATARLLLQSTAKIWHHWTSSPETSKRVAGVEQSGAVPLAFIELAVLSRLLSE